MAQSFCCKNRGGRIWPHGVKQRGGRGIGENIWIMTHGMILFVRLEKQT